MVPPSRGRFELRVGIGQEQRSTPGPPDDLNCRETVRAYVANLVKDRRSQWRRPAPWPAPIGVTMGSDAADVIKKRNRKGIDQRYRSWNSFYAQKRSDPRRRGGLPDWRAAVPMALHYPLTNTRGAVRR